MKAERINQDQIRFTLSEADLTSRNLQMSELSYGSEKTKALFDDMMRAAYEQFGVDFSQKPLMIEAIPLSERSLTITVTRVTGAAELIGFGSGNPITDENYSKGQFTSYLGRALAVLRAGYEAGEAKLTVSAEGVGQTEIALPIEEVK